MSARNFRSVGWVAGIAATALGCYMVNLKVASERAALEDVETRIVLAQRDIRLLQTEIGTRGRLAQLESWNVKVLALSAPSASQFAEGGFQLATMIAPRKTVDPAAPVVLASAPAPRPEPRLVDEAGPVPPAGVAPKDLMRVASYRRELPAPPSAVEPAPLPVPKVQAAPKPAPAKKTVEKPPVAAKAPAPTESKAAKSGKAQPESNTVSARSAPKAAPAVPAKKTVAAAAKSKAGPTNKTKDSATRK